jgi:hypothetical protein
LWECNFRNVLANETLNTQEAPHIHWVDESDGCTSSFGTGRPANTVYVVFRVWWNIVIHYQFDSLYVYSPAKDIGTD